MVKFVMCDRLVVVDFGRVSEVVSPYIRSPFRRKETLNS